MNKYDNKNLKILEIFKFYRNSTVCTLSIFRYHEKTFINL